jgi:hypothetical protein
MRVKMKYGVTLISTFNMDNIRLNANSGMIKPAEYIRCYLRYLPTAYKKLGNKLFSLIKQKLMNLKIKKINLLSKNEKELPEYC